MWCTLEGHFSSFLSRQKSLAAKVCSNNPISTGVLLKEQHPKKNSKKSPEDEEVQKIEFLCGVATYFTILPIPACTPDIIIFTRTTY